jgi:GTP-binding protein
MRFGVNTSPFAGREGKHVQSPRIKARLEKEALHNVALRVEDTSDPDSFIVKGRGEFQMAILIETMRREGFELSVGRPTVLMKEEGGVTLEPIEHLIIDSEEGHVGIITEKLARRKGRMTTMVNKGSGRVRIEFSIPSRGLIGYRGEFLTDTRGLGIMSGYEEFRGEVTSRVNGSLVSDREGEAVAYALFNLEPRGRMLVRPGEKVYEGMIIGEHNRENDLNVNPTKAKKLTNIRAAGKDENVILTPVPQLTLENALEFIRDDELVEVTPESIRMRKRVLEANRR